MDLSGMKVEYWPREKRMGQMEWGDGPWMAEPDRVDFKHAGFPCKIQRNPEIGNLCGYVGVPPGHPWFGSHYGDFDISVHGGVSYGRTCEENPHVCHVPEPGEPDHVFWIGFDCAHAFDFTPSMSAEPLKGLYTPAHVKRMRYEYRDIEYVYSQVINLAKQAKHAAEQSEEKHG